MAININPTKTVSAVEVAKPTQQGWNMELRFGTPKISLTQRMVFTERLSLLLETGVSL